MKILLSIKPEFAEKIFNGTKKYEFRRTIFKNEMVRTVVVYASSPHKRVIGEFEIEKILEEKIDVLWATTRETSGITERLFLKYFNKKERGYAIKIKNTLRYDKELSISDLSHTHPPQSFIYL